MNSQNPIEWSKIAQNHASSIHPRPLSTRTSKVEREQNADSQRLLKLAAGATAVVFCVVVFSAAIALAEGINIGGQDASGQMKDVQTLVTTMQTIGFKWVAPLIGGGLSIVGIFQVATRRLGMGLLALGGGGALFAVEKIANSLSRIAGN